MTFVTTRRRSRWWRSAAAWRPGSGAPRTTASRARRGAAARGGRRAGVGGGRRAGAGRRPVVPVPQVRSAGRGQPRGRRPGVFAPAGGRFGRAGGGTGGAAPAAGAGRVRRPTDG